MGFQVTVPTVVPVNADGTLDQATWGEAGGPFSVPAEEGAGLGAVTLASNTVNYEWQHPARWLRSMMDRMALSDEGLLSSCVLKQGAWNTGGATLDVTLGPTRVVVDANDDGGIVIEIKAPVGSPETLAASRDTYLNLNEAGAFELQVVATDDPPPVPTAGYVSVWVLVTDATELTSANLADGVAAFPCFGPFIGIRAGVIEVPTLGGTAADAVTVTGTMTCAEVVTFDAGIKGTGAAAVTLTEGAILPATKTILGDNTTVIQAGTLTALGPVDATGKITSNTGYEGVAGTAAVMLQGATVSAGKYLLYGISAAPTSQGQTGFDADGEALHYNGDHVRAPGARASGRQEAATAAVDVSTTMQTSKRQTAPVTLHVTASVYVSRLVAGTVTLTIEEDNGLDVGQLWSALGTANPVANLSGNWTLVQFTRVRVSDGTARYFRLKADSGGSTQSMKEGLLSVLPSN